MKNKIGSFVIADPNKCTGCRACEVACFTMHNQHNNVGYTVGTVDIPVIPRLYLVKVTISVCQYSVDIVKMLLV